MAHPAAPAELATVVPMDVDNELEADSTAISPEPKITHAPAQSANALSKLLDDDADSEVDEPQAQKPRPNILTRLQPQHTTGDSSSDSEDDAGVSAYERVKKMLMNKSTQNAQMESQSTTQAAAQATSQPASTLDISRLSSSEDEDDMPVQRKVIRKTATRIARDTPSPAQSPTKSHSRHSSPGLFVSPNGSPVKRTRPVSNASNDSESDELPASRSSKEMKARVERIRAQRLAKEKSTSAKKQTHSKEASTDDETDSDPDGENGRRLTQQSRPTRKAGKKALEEMSREQQRISRNMQLAHKAKTKKKYTTKDLFARFNYQTEATGALPTPPTSFSQRSSDVEHDKPYDTPPTSPPVQEESAKNDTLTELEVSAASPSLETIGLVPSVHKGKGRAPEFQHLPPNAAEEQATIQRAQVPSIHVEKPLASEMVELSDSEDELKTPRPKSRFPVFDRVPQQKQQQSSSLHHLRHLANLTSPGKKGVKGKPSMTIIELGSSLNQLARKQAQREREEKIEELRRRGIHIETAEEREKHELEIENIVAQLEKARQEDLKLTKLEKAEARKNGEVGDELASSDESDDGDYAASDEDGAPESEPEDEVELELSGSEDESLAEDEDDVGNHNDLIDGAAEEEDKEEDEEDEELAEISEAAAVQDDDDMEETLLPVTRARPSKRARNVIVDDEDDSEADVPNNSTPTQRPLSPTQQDDGMAAAFGFDKSSPSLGLTQMFAGTMADLQTGSQNAHPIDNEPEQDSIAFLRSLPDSQAMVSQFPATLVPNSQTPVSPQKESQVGQSMPQLNLGISQLIDTSPAFSHTQDFEPTQDGGFEFTRSPAVLIAPSSTVDTVMMPVAESPVKQRKGRLHQRKQLIADFSDVEEESTAVESNNKPDADNAFAVLKKAAKKEKKKVDKFNKNTSWAKDIVQEQAEESEDEYAGIGGASDDDSAEDDEELAEMIDHDEVKVDERKLASYFLEKEKVTDEKNINQLYKDIMNGGLRKRRGGDAFDLSDSEDEAEQRRRKKQMQFRQMTKALISDERIGKIAQNPKQAAFFNTLADHLEDPDNDFLNEPELLNGESRSQSQSEEGKETNETADVAIPDSQSAEASVTTGAPVNPLKRKLPDSQEKENRPPAHLRRTAANETLTRKPMTIADIQHSVSELLDDPRDVIPETQPYDSDSDIEIEPPVKAASRKPIIDRLTLSRTTIEVSDAAAGGHMAFVSASGGTLPGFRVPSLIRRATSNLSTASSGSSGTTTPVEGGGVRRGGTGRSNIHAQAREAERRAALDKVEKKRKDELKKKVSRAKNQRSVLASLGGGFE
ncbi:hypothetical protein BU24DRAFT_11004 [Aaosphaeria arxii CBS 175.79]|uniref:DNA replication checkpoint mediator MRC1 domain-containing protein n=1 Tax=Aaosphaeria arxii CBS 175.79 TaxID=1450172 RepID=A0A6A5Y847_9PLEO|nr:uncharacterized protein BU24DRAFT_11004 [Aaosphaeria arxii CBS 175.79]KAF2020921.1 hypothetical protein BU24DRAFT_11004 [Aaosphaeria arxii CBS 175.79]